MVSEPALLTLLLLSIVIAVPLVSVMLPAELTVIASAAPEATVEVLTAVVVDEPIVVSAAALVAVIATRTGAMAVQASKCRMISPLNAAPFDGHVHAGGTPPPGRFRQEKCRPA
jgi:hypothetical protein